MFFFNSPLVWAFQFRNLPTPVHFANCCFWFSVGNSPWLVAGAGMSKRFKGSTIRLTFGFLKAFWGVIYKGIVVLGQSVYVSNESLREGRVTSKNTSNMAAYSFGYPFSFEWLYRETKATPEENPREQGIFIYIYITRPHQWFRLFSARLVCFVSDNKITFT